MLLQSNIYRRKWLILLFTASFLLNIQTSFACAMMPDMAGKNIECCCGTNHRMDDVVERIPVQDYSTDADTALTLAWSDCNGPLLSCCNVEMSVGINDPPGEESISVSYSAKVVPYKLVKQLDSDTPTFIWYLWTSNISLQHSETRVISPNARLHRSNTPQYKATQRYRI